MKPSVSKSDPVATTPTVYGIETVAGAVILAPYITVATTPTVYGIETPGDRIAVPIYR